MDDEFVSSMDTSVNMMSPRVPPSPDSASIHSFSQIEGFVKPDRILEHTRFGPVSNTAKLHVTPDLIA